MMSKAEQLKQQIIDEYGLRDWQVKVNGYRPNRFYIKITGVCPDIFIHYSPGKDRYSMLIDRQQVVTIMRDEFCSLTNTAFDIMKKLENDEWENSNETYSDNL
jgi:hypothetical protein